MKLLNKTNVYYIAVAIAILLIGSFVISNRILFLLNKAINERLVNEKSLIELQIANQIQLADEGFLIGDRIEVIPLEKFHSLQVQLKDTSRYDAFFERLVPYRQLTYEKLINNKAYKIKIMKRLPEMWHLFKGLLITVGLTAIDVIFCFYFLTPPNASPAPTIGRSSAALIGSTARFTARGVSGTRVRSPRTTRPSPP